MHRGFTGHIGPHAKLIVMFWYRQNLNMCKVFFTEFCEKKPPVVLQDSLLLTASIHGVLLEDLNQSSYTRMTIMNSGHFGIGSQDPG